MTNVLIVGCAGFVGSICRYLVYLWFGSRNLQTFPWATLCVNSFGCFLIGAVSFVFEKYSSSHQQPFYLAITVGFLGAFTTFSAFGFETVNLLKAQQTGFALLNIVANLAIGLIAVLAGRFIASLF